MGTIYYQRHDGEWVDVTDEKLVACCDCGLVHSYEHLVVGDRVLRRAFRETRATADRRRTNETKASIKRLKKK